MIKIGRRLFASPYSLQPGDLIEFGYKNTVRLCVVISPDWNGKTDCYQFDRIEDAEEILEWVLLGDKFGSGDLYVDFGNRFDFKSFFPDKMLAIQKIEYNIEEELKEEKTEERIEEIIQDIYIHGGNLYGE